MRHTKILMINLDDEVLAETLMHHAPDWQSALAFLENVSLNENIEFSPDTVSNIIRAEYEQENNMDTYGKWNEEVKATLSVACISDGYEPNDQNLIETLTEAKLVYKETVGEHRWWNDELRVVKIGDSYFGFMWANSTGDTGLSDLGWEFDFGSVDFYESKEVIQIVFVPVSKKGE